MVFHSFRHTVVTALQDGGTPLHISMQIVGHEAQELAIKRGIIKPSAAGSVHLDNYSHPDQARMGAASPLHPMKVALETCVRPKLDMVGLKEAAIIVMEHVHKRAERFITGWAPQDAKYSLVQVRKLRNAAIAKQHS